MISKSIQPAELTNSLSLQTQTAVSSDSGMGDGSSFSSLLSARVPDPTGKESGKPSPVSGNNLPGQGLQTETRTPVADVTTLAVDGPDGPVIAATEFITGSPELPLQPAGAVSSQDVQEQEITGTSQEVVDNKLVMAGQELLPGQLIAGQTEGQAEGQADLYVEQLTELQVHVPDMTSTRLPDQLTGQAVQPSVRMVTHHPRFSTPPAAPAADGRTVAQTVPIDIPVTGADLLHKGSVIEAGQLNGQAAVKAYPAGDAGRASSNQETVSSPVQETARLVLASQTANGDLKQSLQGHRDSHPGGNTVAALARTDTNPLAFLQTLSESSPFTLPSASVRVPVGQQGWGDAVGQQVTWFVSQNVSAANLRMNPQHLGPVEMQISMEGDKANISFLSQHTVVREALESSLPRLREMLAESGLDLLNVNISQHGASEQKGRGLAGFQQGMDFSRTDPGFSETEIDENVQQAAAVATGLIDAYA